jgi:hypothetical protein
VIDGFTSEKFCFALKSDDTLAVTDNGRRPDLDRDLAFQVGIARPIDFAHATGAEQRGDFIRAEARARIEHQL